MKGFFKALIFALLALFAATALALGFIHLSGLPFFWDIGALNIETASGLPRQEILENYQAVMVYLSPFSSGSFQLPSLGYTAQSIVHFADVKLFFNFVYLLGTISLALLLVQYWRMRRRGELGLLKTSVLLTVLMPAALGAGVAVNFDWAFTFFHSIFFEGDSWLLDPREDEIIKILPAEFFLHCALFIAAVWLLAAVAQKLLYRFHGKKERKR